MSKESQRLKQLVLCVPNIWNNKTCLYIGASVERFHYQSELKKHNIITDIVEINKERCKNLEQEFSWLNKIICGNIVSVSQLFNNKYDLILWSHGPEILDRKDIIPTIKGLEDITNNLIVLMSPWGKYTYSNTENLLREDTNTTSLYEHNFIVLGYRVSTIGNKDENGSNLLAWKFI